MTRHVWIADALVRAQLARVEQVLVAETGSARRPVSLRRQLLSVRSKRLRPAVLLLAARFADERAAGATGAVLERTAASLELIHEATLFHDDVIDRAGMRRGEVTVQRATGPAVAALAGLELFYAGSELVADLPSRLRRAIAHACHTVCDGNLRDIEATGDIALTPAERIRIMRGKAARFFELAAHLGAGIAGVHETTARHLVRFGHWFGMCFQLADDVRDLLASEDTLGRPPGGDLRDGMYTLPILYALRAEGPEADELRDCLAALRRQPADGLLAHVVRLAHRAGGFARAGELFEVWRARAGSELAALPARRAPAARRSLEALLAISWPALTPGLAPRPAVPASASAGCLVG